MKRGQPTVFVVHLSLKNHACALALMCGLSSCEPSSAAPNPPAGPDVSSTQSSVSAPHTASHTVHAPTLASSAQAETPTTLTLGAWNLAWLSASNLRGPVKRATADYERLARHARSIDADVIAVQEVESVEALARVFDSKRYNFHVTSDRSSQKTGFVYAKRLNVEIFADYTAIAAGGLRSAADIGLRFEQLTVRLLSVHLKSGCFDRALHRNEDCRAFGSQVPKLEAWLDARATEATPFAVLGDFNRRLFGRIDDEVWAALDDGAPPESDLDSPTRDQRSTCWSAIHPQYIDHLVLSRTLSQRVVPSSFRELSYGLGDAPFRKQLSDHCPITVTLTLGSSAATPPVATVVALDSNEQGPIRGNISRSGKRWYHTIDCPAYFRVKIDTAKGERFFATEIDAQRAGFERAPGCRK